MRNILVIENDEILKENIVEILTLSNYGVLTASDGKKGVEIAVKDNPDLIICDMLIPNLDGFGVLKIVSLHPKTSAIPFILITGINELDNQRKGMNLGADDYLIKPFTPTELLNVISIRLRKSENLKRNFHNHGDVFPDFLNIEGKNNSGSLPHENRDPVKYKKKHLLYVQGQRPVALYYILKGKVKEFLINDEGKQLITNMYSTGDFFGYTEIFKDSKYLKNAQVIEAAELVLIPKKKFLQLIHNDSLIARQFMTLLSHNLYEKEENLLNMAYNPLRKKVAKGITNVIDKFKDVQKDGKPVIEISRQDLAHVVGSSPESMIRTLKEFKAEKLIDVLNRTIIILNESKLRDLKQ